MSNTVIAVENLSKLYRLGQVEKRSDSLLASLTSALSAPLRNFRDLRGLDVSRHASADGDGDASLLWALKDVSFEIQRGEVIGIIGRNGAGKSTLLKILSRVAEPTSGRVRLRGRLASLLEVGTGFHPDLSGRENVYLNGTILGMSKREIDRKFDEIVAFSEVERFLDTPVKRYSSGMKVRLGFAVAAHLEPDILIVDEVLAVGDAAFQKKCLGKMQDVANNEGRTIIFISHQMGAVSSLTTRCIFLESGQIRGQGSPQEVIRQYLAAGNVSTASWRAARVNDGPMQFLAAQVLDHRGQVSGDLDVLQPLDIAVDYEIRRPLESAVLAVILHASDGAVLFSSEDTDTRPELLDGRTPGRYRGVVRIPGGWLNQGEYYIRLGCGVPGHQTFENTETLRFSLINTGDHRTRGHRAAYFMPTLPWELESVPLGHLQESISR